MIEIFQKRGKWCYRKDGRLFKFATEEEAKRSLGFVELETIEDAEEEIEAEDSEEETYTDEQETVFDSESNGEEEV